MPSMTASGSTGRAELLAAFARNVRHQVVRQIERERARAEELRSGVLPIVAAAVARARGEGLCGRAWIFGSFVWGMPGERSDVDVLVEDTRDPDGFAALLARACARDVHVVRRERAPGPLVDRALAEGLAV